MSMRDKPAQRSQRGDSDSETTSVTQAGAGQALRTPNPALAGFVRESYGLQSVGVSRIHGGRRDDLGFYVRSGWEANYARYLIWLKSIGEVQDWAYEPDTFEFPVKRGTRFYTPDFKVTWKDGKTEYHEVKGYLTQKGRTALKRMGKYHPDVKVVVIDGQAYRALQKQVSALVPNWEG